MSRELTALVDQQQAADDSPAAGVTDTAVRDYVRAVLRQYRADEDALLERISALEEEGRRIIDGGQTGQDTWEITDWRTGDLIVKGTGGLEAYGEAAQRLDPDGTWLHRDNLDVEPEDVEPVGVPASLAASLQDWLGMPSTPDEDVAQFVGWSVEDVAHHREHA